MTSEFNINGGTVNTYSAIACELLPGFDVELRRKYTTYVRFVEQF